MKKNQFYIEKENIKNQIDNQCWLLKYEVKKTFSAKTITLGLLSYSLKKLLKVNKNEGIKNTSGTIKNKLKKQLIKGALSYLNSIFK